MWFLLSYSQYCLLYLASLSSACLLLDAALVSVVTFPWEWVIWEDLQVNYLRRVLSRELAERIFSLSIRKLLGSVFLRFFMEPIVKSCGQLNVTSTLKYVRIQITLFIANTRKYLQSDWLIEVQYWSYLYSGVGKK